VRPDVLISCQATESDWVTEPPILILEILSPATVLQDRNTKFKLYQAYGVCYYLIADLGKKQIEIFELRDNVYHQTNDLKNFRLTEACTIQLAVQDLFS
jgi:Uma2 family endonuclease